MSLDACHFVFSGSHDEMFCVQLSSMSIVFIFLFCALNRRVSLDLIPCESTYIHAEYRYFDYSYRFSILQFVAEWLRFL